MFPIEITFRHVSLFASETLVACIIKLFTAVVSWSLPCDLHYKTCYIGQTICTAIGHNKLESFPNKSLSDMSAYLLARPLWLVS